MEEQEPKLDLQAPGDGEAAGGGWELKAHNRRVLKGWEWLCRHTPEDARRCYEWLRNDAMRPIPRRCYALGGRLYEGCWLTRLGAGIGCITNPISLGRRPWFIMRGRIRGRFRSLLGDWGSKLKPLGRWAQLCL